jgi:hypothetical protein
MFTPTTLSTILQLYSYTMEISYLLAEEAGTPGSALIPDTLLLSQALQVHLATGTNRTHLSYPFYLLTDN